MIPFYLVTGFLGSGKTTLVKRMLEEYGDQKQVGIIQNEFAPANLDGIDLQQTGRKFKILEINKGSVFCVCLLSNFIESLHEFIVQEKPDILILEASGLSDPVSIGELLDAPALRHTLFLAHIWCVVDALRFLQMEPKMTRITHQVRIADTVIINKTDQHEDIATLEDRIRQLNPYAQIMGACWCDVAFQQVIENPTTEPVARKTSREIAAIQAGGRPEISSVVIRTAQALTPEGLYRFLAEYVPRTYRIKGYVRLSDGSVKALQTSFDRVQTTDLSDYSGNTELIAMGDDLGTREMRNIFKR